MRAGTPGSNNGQRATARVIEQDDEGVVARVIVVVVTGGALTRAQASPRISAKKWNMHAPG